MEQSTIDVWEQIKHLSLSRLLSTYQKVDTTPAALTKRATKQSEKIEDDALLKQIQKETDIGLQQVKAMSIELKELAPFILRREYDLHRCFPPLKPNQTPVVWERVYLTHTPQTPWDLLIKLALEAPDDSGSSPLGVVVKTTTSFPEQGIKLRVTSRYKDGDFVCTTLSSTITPI